ncbi:STAS domain-containing protein [Streptomyces sp. SID2119]|nr:STAS domain-containing protein [Streptomyces sp. SID2119]
MHTPSLLFVDLCHRDTGTAIVLAGAMDSDSVHGFTTVMRDVLRAGTATVHLDLSALAFCDCGGLTALLRASQDSRREGRPFQAHAPSRAVLRLFTLTGTASTLLSREFPAGGALRPPLPSRTDLLLRPYDEELERWPLVLSHEMTQILRALHTGARPGLGADCVSALGMGHLCRVAGGRRPHHGTVVVLRSGGRRLRGSAVHLGARTWAGCPACRPGHRGA